MYLKNRYEIRGRCFPLDKCDAVADDFLREGVKLEVHRIRVNSSYLFIYHLADGHKYPHAKCVGR